MFGSLDYLCKREYTHPLTHEQQWNIVAGNVCFDILFPFGNDSVNKALHGSSYASFVNEDNNQILSDNEKISFVQTHLQDTASTWEVEVIYFHKKFIDKLYENPSVFKLLLFQIGWRQSGYLRDTLFESKIVSDRIENLACNCSNKVFLSALYNYLLRVIRCDAYVLRPIPDNHILYEANSSFKNALSANYFTKKNAFHPIILGYEKLYTDKNWGILAFDWLPILLEYKKLSISLIKDDLDFIKNEIYNSDSRFTLKHTTFSNKSAMSKHFRLSSNSDKYITLLPSNEELKNKISALPKYHDNNICLTSSKQGLTDFLIIEKEYVP